MGHNMRIDTDVKQRPLSAVCAPVMRGVDCTQLRDNARDQTWSDI